MNEPISERIIDASLRLAETSSWESVRLHQVAAYLGITLEDIRQHYREKEDLVDAWFDRADRETLQYAVTPEFLAKNTRERLHSIIMVWLDTLTVHRRITREMIMNKLEPGHLHFQIPALMRISRTVQWMREAAGLTATFPRRALEETKLTGIYLLAFIHWMRDRSEGSANTRRFLDRLLGTADRLSFGRCPTWQRKEPVSVNGASNKARAATS